MKRGFILGLTTGVVLTGASLALASTQIQAILNDQIKVTLNGQVQEFKDETTNETQYPITYKDRTYLPLRTVANLVGVDVDYDANSNTAILKNDKDTIYNLITNSNGKLTEAEAIGLGSMMYKLANDAYNSHYVEWEGFIDLKNGVENQEMKHKILNLEYMNYFKELFSESKFKKFVGIEKDNSTHEVGNIIYENGDYYFVDDAGGGPYGLVGSKLIIKSLNDDRIEFEVVTVQSATEVTSNNGVADITGSLYDVKPFVLVKENGKWKVDDFVNTYYE